MGKLLNINNGGTLMDIWVLDGNLSCHTKTITTPEELKFLAWLLTGQSGKTIY